MKTRAWLGAMGLSLAIVGVEPAAVSADDGFRCESGRLVSLGDLAYEVQKKCGEPDQVTERLEKRTVRHKVRRWVGGVAQEITEEREVDIPVQDWIYDMGPHRLLRLLRFENEHLVRVSTGKRGVQAR